MTFSHDDTLIMVDGPVLEVFRRGVEGSLRIPLAWLGVWLDTSRPRFVIGLQSSVGGPVYSEHRQELTGAWRSPVEAAAIPEYRAFFAEVAALAGRP